MARKTSRTILIVLLVISALIGMSAIGISYYYSQIDDVTPTDTNADDTTTACVRIYLNDLSSGTELDTLTATNDFALATNSETVIGAEFRAPQATTGTDVPTLGDFQFTVNTTAYNVNEGDYEVTQAGTVSYFFPEFELSEFEGVDSITIQVVPLEDGEPMRGVEECQPLIVAVDQEAVIPDPTDDTCIAEGLSGGRGTQCCTGLVEIGCEEQKVGTVDQCEASPEDCFTCVESANDDECGAGENFCNSPNDCTAIIGPPPVPDACIELGEESTEIGIDTPTCCLGLIAASCSALNSDTNQCDERQGCFVCIESDEDNICGTGENSCNSPEDCPIDDEEETPPIIVPEEAGLSNFVISMSGPACFERVSPNNDGQFTITVTNNDSEIQDITKIVGSAPLGYTYIGGSSIINGTADLTDQYVSVVAVGSSQQITWSTPSGWSVSPGGRLTIQFSLIAGSAALTDTDVLFEAVVTPENIPVSSTALRGTYSFTTAQSCSSPKTGLFDSTLSKIVAGGIVMLFSIVFYITNIGQNVSASLVGSRAARKAELLSLKYTNPREYFEEKFKDRESEK